MSRILIIDDDPSIVSYLKKTLEDEGHSTCSVTQEGEVDNCLRNQRPDLVVLDLEISHEWGPKFYRTMVLSQQFKDIPVIIIGGLSGIQLAVTNAAASFRKPVNPEELVESIRNTLNA